MCVASPPPHHHFPPVYFLSVVENVVTFIKQHENIKWSYDLGAVLFVKDRCSFIEIKFWFLKLSPRGASNVFKDSFSNIYDNVKHDGHTL